MTITLMGDELADKYETKRTGLTLDEAFEAVVLGYHVTSPSIAANAYIHYEFNGLRIQFVHDGRLGSSSGWSPERADQVAEWSIVPLASEVKRDAWGKPVTQWPVARSLKIDGKVVGELVSLSIELDSWGRPINGA